MKTQIIHLEPHDDTISVRDKMGWSQTGRVILVWPARGRLLDRRLDLVLLLRHSQSLGVQIALVTNDGEVRSQAKMLGISVYKSIRKAQKSRWQRPPRKRILTSQEGEGGLERLTKLHEILSNPLHREREARVLPPRVRTGIFTLGVLAVLSIAAVLIPSAEITITPETRDQVINLQVQASESVDKINLAGILPIQEVNTIVEGRGSIQTTGSVDIPTGFASGIAQFENLTDQTVFIPQGTVISALESEQRFGTQRAAQLPAGLGEEIEIPIQALLPGSTANLSPGSLNAVEGELGVFLTVENLAPISGGTETQSPAPTSQDRFQLKEQLISVLTENALQEIQSSLDPKYVLLEETPTLAGELSESYYPPDLQPASELELILRLEFEAPYVSAADQEALAAGILDANLPTGFTALPETMTIKTLTTPQFKDGANPHWRVQLRRFIQSEPSPIQAVNLALGRSPESAAQRLDEELPLSAPPIIKTYPSWWPVMPFIPLRITITPAVPGQASTTSQAAIQE